MPLYAAIDVGSNTFRLLIGNIKEDGITDVLYERRVTRLGEGVDNAGNLQEKNIEISLAALKEFSSFISRYGIKHIKAVATSALRESSNSDIFIKKVFNDTGISIEVISGEKEAEFTLRGVVASFPKSILAEHTLFIIDIGGGSTEWILHDKNIVDMGSIPLGVIKLSGNFIKTDPISASDIKRINSAIIPFLDALKIKIGKYINRNTLFIGTAGTFSTIASIDLCLETYSREKIHLHRLSLERLLDMSRRLYPLTLDKRKKVKGLEPERADLIIPGIQFTINVMDFFGFDELTVSDYGLLEGVLIEMFQGER
ncbi:MAG: Ppx/GppA phosphatase family protein [Nitrospirota bacterium]